MRWTEIAETYGDAPGVIMPTYRQMDTWTRDGKLTAETHGDRHGRYRWWAPTEVEAALMAAGLVKLGMTADLAFFVARGEGNHKVRRASASVTSVGPDVLIQVITR